MVVLAGTEEARSVKLPSRLRLIALAVAVLAGLLIAVLVAGWAHWLGDRAHADFWPLDNSRIGPNLVASAVQAVIVFLVVALLYPPLRRWAEAELEHVHAKADHTLDLLHHIIEHHPDIPNDDPLGNPWRAKRPARGRPR